MKSASVPPVLSVLHIQSFWHIYHVFPNLLRSIYLPSLLCKTFCRTHENDKWFLFPPRSRFTNAASLAAHKSEHDRLAASPEAKPAAVKVVKTPTAKNNPADGGEVKATCPECHKTFRRHFNMKIHVDRVSKTIFLSVCPTSTSTDWTRNSPDTGTCLPSRDSIS